MNRLLQRCGTAITKVLTAMLVVPAKDFHEIVKKLGMQKQFEDLCVHILPWGLCGRCGMLGDHFSDQCPNPCVSGYPRANGTLSDLLIAHGPSGLSSKQSEHSKMSESGDLSTHVLISYLKRRHLESVLPLLLKQGVKDLEGLVNLDVGLIHEDPEFKAFEANLSSLEEAATERSIGAYLKQMQRLNAGARHAHHLLFLSHFKGEAGTEACLMRSELEKLLPEFQEPCFLDSENLWDLTQLQAQVTNSENLILLCTTNILTRPWCLVEIWTAHRNDVPILPVNVLKPGNEFAFPGESFYEAMLKGDLLDPAGLRTLEDCGVALPELVDVIRTIFKRIAVSYSPHASRQIREAELKMLLARCNRTSVQF